MSYQWLIAGLFAIFYSTFLWRVLTHTEYEGEYSFITGKGQPDIDLRTWYWLNWRSFYA